MPKMARKNYRKKTIKKVKKVRISKPKGGDIISNNNYCTVSETSQDNTNAIINENNPYRFTVNIADFPRALAMSKFFRWYRPKLVSYKYLPLYTDFAEGGGSKPEFLYTMNRTGDIVSPATKGQYLAMGAKPTGFGKVKTIRYRPNLCQTVSIVQETPTLTNYANIGTVPIYNWVQTYGNQLADAPVALENGIATQGLLTSEYVDWHGHNVIISTAVPAGAAPVAKFYCECIWEFKEPLSSYRSPN